MKKILALSGAMGLGYLLPHPEPHPIEADYCMALSDNRLEVTDDIGNGFRLEYVGRFKPETCYAVSPGGGRQVRECP